MLEIEEIEKLSEEELKQICDIEYIKDKKCKDFKIITYQKKENYKMREEQIQYTARFICDNISDVRKFIEENKKYTKKLEKM